MHDGDRQDSRMTQLIGVGKRYGRGPLVVHDVDVEISPGTPLAIHGANGSGKSTLLRLVVGCFAPTHGRVVGRPSTVGYVPDRFPGLLRMSADAYLRHLGRIRPATRVVRIRQPCCRRSGFEVVWTAHEPVVERQRAEGRPRPSPVLRRPLLVLDEPWSRLETDARPALTAAVAQLAANGTAVVLTDHSRTAETLPDHRALLLRDRQLTTVGRRMVTISLRCADPDRVAERLPLRGTAKRQPGGLHLHVPAGNVDTLLTTALRSGCSVLEVRS
jgi:ABC-type multidrug transport system ATPase subunit